MLAHQVASQVTGIGQCPPVTPVQNFNVTQYLGRWYEIRAYRTTFEFGSNCVTADYGSNTDGSVSVVNTLRSFGQQRSISGSATIPKPGQGALIVNFFGLESKLLNVELDLF